MHYSYHRLGRAWPNHRWWKPLLVGLIGTVIYLVLSTVYLLAFIVPSVIDGTVESFLDQMLTPDLTDPVTFAIFVGSIALMLPAIILATLILGPKPIGVRSSVAGRLRWKWLARCIPIALVVYGVVFSLSFLVLDPLTGAPPIAVTVTSSTVLLVVLALLLTPLQSTAEEYVFRGYLMQTIGSWLKHPAWAILLPVPLFAIGHDYDIWGLLDVSIFAIVAGYLTWRTGGLEAAIVAHVVNNTTLFVLGAFGITDLNAKTGSPFALISTVVLLGAYSALVLWQAKRTGLETTRLVHPPEPPQERWAPPVGAYAASVSDAVPAYGAPAAAGYGPVPPADSVPPDGAASDALTPPNAPPRE